MSRKDEQIDCGNGVTLHVRHNESPEKPDFWVTVYFPLKLYFRSLADAESYARNNHAYILKMTQNSVKGWMSIIGKTFETP